MGNHCDIYLGEGIHITSADLVLLLKERSRIIYNAFTEEAHVALLSSNVSKEEYERHHQNGGDLFELFWANPDRDNLLGFYDCIYDVLDLFSNNDYWNASDESAIIWLNPVKPKSMATIKGTLCTETISLVSKLSFAPEPIIERLVSCGVNRDLARDILARSLVGNYLAIKSG